MNTQKPREIAVRLLAPVAEAGNFIEKRLETELDRQALTPADHRLVMELVYGVIRWQRTLDWLIARKTSSREPKPLLRNLLRLGLYQMFWLDRIPDHAAVNESVELAKSLRDAGGAGFVNAILRAYVRDKEATRKALEDLRIHQPALGWSHPDWLADRWISRWGGEAAARLMQWNNQPPSTFARINTLRTSPDALLDRWREEGVVSAPVAVDWLPGGQIFELKAHPPLAQLPSFQSGGFYVQDPSTLLAPQLLAVKPGESILDACAAPGGKTGYLAQMMTNQGRLVAQDQSPDRLDLLRQNLARLGVECATVVSADWSGLPAESFDGVLLDVPCSNTGVMRRRVELRWRLEPEETARLAAGQAELLDRAARLVKPNGRLVYSTCSIEPEENQAVVARFLERHPGWRCAVQPRTLLPFQDRVDGAYAARLEKSA